MLILLVTAGARKLPAGGLDRAGCMIRSGYDRAQRWRLATGDWRLKIRSWELETDYRPSAPTNPGRIGGASGIRSKPTSLHPSCTRRKYARTGDAHVCDVAPVAPMSTRM